MAIADDFKKFCKAIRLQDEEMKTSAGEIAKKLNKYYYDLDGEKFENMYIVGSVGRSTATKNSSDLDLLFRLPYSEYLKYNSRTENGQSDLLQDLKNILKDRYPNTDIRGDGQVVVIDFSKYTVELVPGFSDGAVFKYPDTHNGGSWKTTNPLSEQVACLDADVKSECKYYDFCHILRAWKNKQGVEFGGLLIDTLVYKYFEDEEFFSEKDEEDYLDILQGLFDYLKSRNKDQSYWYAPGSNQRVYNKGKGAFVKAAKKADEKIKDTIENYKDINNCLRDLLGNDFPQNSNSSEERAILKAKFSRNTSEEYIEDIFPVDIRYNLQLECKVTQDGFRDDFLSSIIRKRQLLKINKKLDFYIESTDAPLSCDIYWKVRNVGTIAEKKKCVRGEIKKTNDEHQIEHTNFKGEHFVECYLVSNGICVARAHMDVPISTF